MSRNQEENRGLTGFLRKILLLGPHTCPWWFGYSFDNPLRRFVHDPHTILSRFAGPGNEVVDIGCGLGYFSMGLARLVGSSGRVIALDVQAQMIQRARRRAERHGLANRIDFHVCPPDRLGVETPVDFVLAFWVIHEVSHPKRLLEEVWTILRPEGRLLIVEPIVHVGAEQFTGTAELARQVGYEVNRGPEIRFSRTIECVPIGTSDVE